MTGKPPPHDPADADMLLAIGLVFVILGACTVPEGWMLLIAGLALWLAGLVPPDSE